MNTPRGGPRFRCSVRVQFLPEQSKTPDGPFAFAYTVTVRNEGDRSGQLVGRQWLITDALGRTEEVRGLGVVGQQPLIEPGHSFEYSSWTRVATPHGSMQGTFFCISDDARSFETEVPEFMLLSPGALH
jgi:ApaG protein